MGKLRFLLRMRDAKGQIVAQAEGKEGTLKVEKAHLWKVRNAYLYTFTATVGTVDEYSAKIGVSVPWRSRTISSRSVVKKYI